MSMNTVPERLAALREAMKANGVDVYLIPVGDPHASEYMPDHYTALTYFSGFHGENSNFVVTMTESAVWADGRYFVQAEKEIAGTEIQLMRMGEPGVPTAEQYCGKVLPEGGKLGLCGLTASCGLVRSLQKELDAKKGTIKLLNLEDELWTEGRPALPATPAWLLPKEYAGFSPAEKLGQLRAKLSELGCTAQLVGKLDNLAWLLNLRAMDIQCTPYAMAYCYVTPDKATLFIDTARVSAEAAAELKENGVELAEYDDVLTFLAAQAEEQTVLADPVSVNYAVYQTLQANPALTVKDEADPLLPMKGVKNEVELAHTREAHIRDGVAMVRFQIELENRLAAGEELTELTIDEILHKYRSAQDKFLTESFGTIAAYGPNAAMMHYHATEEDHAKLEKKGFLLVDSGATYMDGTTDITRTYPLGGLTEDERLFYTWTLQCHIDIARAVWLDYCDGHMLDTIAREPLWRHLINYRAAETVADEACRNDLFERQDRIAFLQSDAQLFEGFTGGTLLRQGETGSQLTPFGSQGKGGQYAGSRGDASCGDERDIDGLPDLRDEGHGGRLLTAVVTSGFESFGHDGVYACIAAFEGEFRARHHVCHAAAGVVQTSGPGRWAAGRCENGRHVLFYDNIH